ncbi:amino acid ABC transporter permease [Actinopolymorpha alba]|uniref:amino acid ABC transporter permease n=1 Tax=Actinopolymorpha alba TaxID=533267 RepID=UPI000377225E|nr:amino acid ABC transporter permease [Actinopolymorpha alba]
MSSVLYDEPGPRTRRRILIGTIIGGALVAVIVGAILYRLSSQGMFEARRWDVFADPQVWQFLGNGLLATLQAAAVAAVFAVILGLLFAVWRMSESPALRMTATFIIELFRGLPVLLLMFFTLIVFGLESYWAVVAGLAIYNAAIIGEILRAGILSLPRGQTEAAYAIGLTHTQTLLMILLPQAIRRMMPSLVSQLVVLLKDSSLGYIVGYLELLRSVQNLRDFFGNRYLFSVFFVAAGIYITVNFALSRLAVYFERRGSKKTPAGVAAGLDEDGAAPAA